MNEERHLRLALSKKQQRIAERLAKMDPDEVQFDEEFQALDEKQPMTAFTVACLIDLLQRKPQP